MLVLLWLFDEQGFDEVYGGSVQMLQLLLGVADVDLRDVEEGLLLVVSQERRDSRQHHVRQNADAPVGQRRITAQHAEAYTTGLFIGDK